MKTCMHCGHENDDAAVRCACGQDLGQVESSAPVEPSAPALPLSAVREPRLVVRKLLFALGSIALVFLYGHFRHRVGTSPLTSSLLVTGVWAAIACAGLWFLGREKQRMLLVWRIAFLLTATALLFPILNMADGLMELGWPSGRFNRPIARILKVMIPLTATGFLLGILTHLRLYRLSGLFAILTGITSLVFGAYLIPATKGIMHLSITLGEVLNNTMFAAKLQTYAALPLGVVFIVGGILIVWGDLARVRAPSTTD